LGHYNRIGHLAAFPELYLRRRSKSNAPLREKHVFVCGHPANRQMLTMIQRQMTVIENEFFVTLYHQLHSLKPQSRLWVDLPKIQDSYEDSYEDFTNISPQMSFTPKEEEQGAQLLNQMGLKTGTPFVCLHVRDGRYLEKMQPSIDWSYHNYRDCHIENYYAAIEYLTSLGIYVLRMGQVFNQDLGIHDPLLIDYAKKFRSDFGDVYLSAKCSFFIASEGGLNSVAWTFNVPVVYTNGIPPVTAVGWRKEDIFIHKKLWSINEQRFLSYREIIDRGIDRWVCSQNYQEAGIDVIENSPEEILGAVKEMALQLKGEWLEKEEDKVLRERYRGLIPDHHRRKNFLSKIGIDFLNANKKLLERHSVQLHKSTPDF